MEKNQDLEWMPYAYFATFILLAISCYRSRMRPKLPKFIEKIFENLINDK